jgi:hypothetical protein
LASHPGVRDVEDPISQVQDNMYNKILKLFPNLAFMSHNSETKLPNLKAFLLRQILIIKDINLIFSSIPKSPQIDFHGFDKSLIPKALQLDFLGFVFQGKLQATQAHSS